MSILREGSISSATFAQGDAGRVTVQADQLIIEAVGTDGFTGVSSSTFAGGDAGSVTVKADHVLIAGEGAQIGIASEAGVFIADDGQVVVSQGDAGAVAVMVIGDLEIRSAGVVSSTTRGEGDAGTVTVAADRLLIDGEDSFFVTGVVSDAAASGTRDGQLVAVAQGAAGSVIVAAREIELRNSGQIRSSTFGPGDAGAVAVGADRLLIDGAGSRGLTGVKSEAAISAFGVRGEGDAGAVTVTVSELEILNGGRISSSSFGPGVAGTITIHGASRLVLDRGSVIFTVSGFSGGGDIRIEAHDLVLLRDRSRIGVDVFSGGARAGNIVIDPRFLVLHESTIGATADAGSGGRIDIKADQLILSPGSEITARAGPAGIDGTVVVNAPDVDLSGGLVLLEAALLDAASQLRERCGARRDIGASSFTGVGRGGLPPGPDGPLASVYSSAFGASEHALVVSGATKGPRMRSNPESARSGRRSQALRHAMARCEPRLARSGAPPG